MEKSSAHKEVHATTTRSVSPTQHVGEEVSHLLPLNHTSLFYSLSSPSSDSFSFNLTVSLCIFTSSTLSRKRRARHLNWESRWLRSPCGELLVPPSILSAVCSLRNENQLSGRVLDKQQHRANAHIHNICTCFHEDTHTYTLRVV